MCAHFAPRLCTTLRTVYIRRVDTILLAISASLSAIALGSSAVSLALHWAKRDEHPDVAQVRAEITHIRTEISDLLDRFEHWTRRDRTRKLRAAREQDQTNVPDRDATASAANGADAKSALRRRVFGSALRTPSSVDAA